MSRRSWSVKRTALLVGAAVAAIAAALRLSEPAAGAQLLAWVDGLQDLWSRLFSRFDNFGPTAALLVKASVFLATLWFVTRMLSRAFRAELLDKTALDEGLKFSLQRIVSYSFFTLGALAGLHMFGVDLSSIAVFSGALGIGLGLGFQTIAKNFASGLILLVEQPIKVGDRVQVEDLLGDIVHIGARGTWVRTNENVVMIVPNSEFIEGRVTNWTANDRNVRINVPFGVSYESDPERVRSVVLHVAQEHADVLDDPPCDVIFIGFGDSSLDFELRIWTSRQVTTPKIIASDIYFKLFAAFTEEGIEIPYPQRDVHLRSVSQPVRVEALHSDGRTETR